MDEAAYRRLIRGEARGPMAILGRSGLGVLAGVYRLGVAGRNLAFDRTWKAIHKAAVPVVSVGNLTLGGTGKTPMVEWTARRLREHGLRVAILSRGYGRTEGLNDEGRLLDQNLPDVPHLQDRDRVRLAEIAVEELESQVLVLDDGFQHRRLARSLDLVLIDALDPFGQDRLFPRGLLREPVRALRRSDVVVLSRADLIDEPERSRIRRIAERRAGPLNWVEARQEPRDLIDAEGCSSDVRDLVGTRVAAFCGIGNPEGFRRTIEPLVGRIAGFRTFPDHHPYGATDVTQLATWVRELNVEVALTTQKDLVKLRVASLGGVPLRALRIGLDLMDGGNLLETAVDEIARRIESA